MAIDLNVLRSKLDYMKSRVTKRTVIREKRPGAQSKAGKLLSYLEQNAQSGKVEYSKSEVNALMDTYVKADAKNLAFNRKDILLNTVNKNDQIYKFFFEDNGIYHFVTKESVQGKNIAITWSPSKINVDRTFKVGVNRSGAYHWDFSEVEKVLAGDSTTGPSVTVSGDAKQNEAPSGENPILQRSEDSSMVSLSTEARAEVTPDVRTLEHPKSDATQSSVQNLVDSNSDVQQRGSIQKELRKLKGLFDEGLIDEDEYKEMKLNVIRASSNSTTPPSASPQHLDDMGTRIDSSGSVLTPPPPSIDELGTMVGGPNTLPPGLDTMGTMVGSADIEVIGSYRILELLGQGGMGSVFKGRHINEQYAQAMGDVAIKMIQPSLASDASFKSRFINEAIFGKKLSHPNIASVIDVVDDGGVLALLMDFVEGQELKALIPEGGMAVEDVLSLLKPIASALDYLHEQGIVHRDMKPANIRVKLDGTPVILDFGIAKDTNEVDSSMTQTGTAMGTQTYMAPEQMDAKRVTGAADQYALAMMAYQMLSGTLPWDEGLSSVRVTMAKMTGDFKGLEHVDGVSGSVNRMVMRGLSLNPEDRFDSCSEFVVEIERAPNDQQLVLEQQRLNEEQERIDQERLAKEARIPEKVRLTEEANLETQRQADLQQERERLDSDAKLAAEKLEKDREVLAALEAREASSSVDSSSTGLKIAVGLLLIGGLGYSGYSYMDSVEQSGFQSRVDKLSNSAENFGVDVPKEPFNEVVVSTFEADIEMQRKLKEQWSTWSSKADQHGITLPEGPWTTKQVELAIEQIQLAIQKNQIQERLKVKEDIERWVGIWKYSESAQKSYTTYSITIAADEETGTLKYSGEFKVIDKLECGMTVDCDVARWDIRKVQSYFCSFSGLSTKISSTEFELPLQNRRCPTLKRNAGRCYLNQTRIQCP